MRLSCQAVTSAGFVILPVLCIFPFFSFFGGGGGEIRCYMVRGFILMCSSKLLYFLTILQALSQQFRSAGGCQAKQLVLAACVPPLLKYYTFLSSEWGIKIDAGLSCGLAVFRTDVAS